MANSRTSNLLAALFWLIVAGVCAWLVMGCSLHYHSHKHYESAGEQTLTETADRLLDEVADDGGR